MVALGGLSEDEIIHSRAPKRSRSKRAARNYYCGETDGFQRNGRSPLSASFQLNEADKEKNKGAVQEPNPIFKTAFNGSDL